MRRSRRAAVLAAGSSGGGRRRRLGVAYELRSGGGETLLHGEESEVVKGGLGLVTYLNKVYDWFEERLEIQAIADDITSKYVPPHVNIFYCLGGITLTCFLVQVATGFAMTFYYRPTVTEAFSSVQYIITEANFGGFKKPRELTWVTGVVLAVLTASFGVTGYSLPWDQIGYWAVKIVTGVPDAIPFTYLCTASAYCRIYVNALSNDT
uniref:Uncharacterized protein n=1 Tax=Avena sativa TaxID=4498 RepID=A0ACD6AQU8_AVESA